MNELEPVIEAVSSLRDLLERASNAHTRRSEILAKIPQQLEALRTLLAQRPVQEAVDTALVAVIEATQRFPTEPAAMAYLERRSEEFIDFEMRLYTQLRLKRTDVEHILKLARSELRTASRSVGFAIPRNSDELLTALKAEVDYTVRELHDAVPLSRRAKKSKKKSAAGRFWLGAVGTGLALGDVVLALPTFGLVAPIAIASMTAGAISLGAAAFNDPKVLQNLYPEQEEENAGGESH